MYAAAAAAKSLQSCPTLCNRIDGSPPGSSVPGILQARILEWVAISFSNAWNWKVKVKLFSLVQLLVTPWTAAYHAPPSVGFSRQEYWSGVPLPKYIYFLLFEGIQLHIITSSRTLHRFLQVIWRASLDPWRWYLSQLMHTSHEMMVLLTLSSKKT